MNRRGALASIAAGGLIGMRGPAIAAEEFEPIGVPMALQRVSEHGYYVQGQAGPVSRANEGFNSNAGFVVTAAGVVVFDSLGTPALGERLRRLIAETTTQPIRIVVLSHYHADHVYGAQAFVAPGVEIWAHRLAIEHLAADALGARLAERRESLAPWVNEKTRIVRPTTLLDEDTRFELGGLHLRVLHLGPAHTPEDLMLWVEEDRLLFAADLVFTGRVPFVADADDASWVRALDRVLALRPSVVVTGHGPHSTDPARDLTLTRDYLVFLRTQMTRAFDDGTDFDTAYGQVDWSRFAALPAFEAANRRNAYQVYLNVERDALRTESR